MMISSTENGKLQWAQSEDGVSFYVMLSGCKVSIGPDHDFVYDTDGYSIYFYNTDGINYFTAQSFNFPDLENSILNLNEIIKDKVFKISESNECIIKELKSLQ